MKKILRVATVPQSLNTLLKGQFRFMSDYYEMVAVSSPGENLEELSLREGVRAISVPMERHISIIRDFISLMKLIFLFLKERPDMVHSLTPKAGLLSMLAAWITRVPVRMHTFTGLIFPTATGFMQKLLIMMDRITCFCATDINPEGEGVKRDLIEYKITSKPLHIIANGNVNGIDLSYFDSTEAVVKSSQPYRNEQLFTFCFVGRIVKDKGINELIQAFKRLYGLYSDIRLILVGSFERDLDPVLPETDELIETHPAITSVGFQKDIRPFLVASDAFVFPSYREGFPNVILQAGAMGLASIVTDINGSNEIIVPNQNGLIISPRDENALYEAMKWFYEHQDEVKRMASNARSMIASRYEQHKVWSALLKEYHSLLD